MANILAIAGPDSKYKLPGAEPAGFLAGFWHGLVAVFVFVVGLFNPKVSVWETNNNGNWYAFGFLLGIGALSNGSHQHHHH